MVIKSVFIIIVLSILVGCGNHEPDTPTSAKIQPNPVHDTTPQQLTDDSTLTIQPIKRADGKLEIDWALVDSKTPKTDPTTFNYPFALDSEPVKNYANEYKITPKQAQHSMMLAMASPEVLGKLLDQLGNSYIDHKLTDGSSMSLVVFVKPNFVGGQYDYVFADDFAKGLTLPVIIEPKP